MRKLFLAVLVGVCLCFVPGLSFAQGNLGAITGSVLDPSHAVIPDAALTITETTTNVTSRVKATSAGYYRVPVPPGTYNVEAKKEGFKVGVAENIRVGVADVVTIDITLQVGSTSQSVTVASEAPLLTTATAEVGSSVTPTEFATLPIAINDGGRQLQTFIFTSLPGTIGDPFAGSINGGQLFSSEILIDGMSIARFDLNGGNLTEFSPSTDAIGEFKVQQANYSAEYGETGGGIANFSMKSGTNAFHGTAYDYLINDALNAAGFENNALGQAKATVKDNNFGGTFGGPIRKNKLFFFLSYEGDRYRSFNIGSLITLPTVPMKQGDFSAWLNDTDSGNQNQIGTDALGRPVFQNEIYDPTTTRNVTAGQIDPVTKLVAQQDATIRDPFAFGGKLNVIDPAKFSSASSQLLPLYPNPQFTSLINNEPSFAGSVPILTVDKTSDKIDYVINARQRLAGSFTWTQRNRFNRNARSFPPFPGFPLNPVKQQITGGDQLRLSHDLTINDHTLNRLSFAYNRFNNLNNITPNAKYTPALGIPGISNDCFPTFKFSGHIGQLRSFGVGCENIDPSESYLLQDTLSYLRGKHSFKFGGEYVHYRYNTFEPGPLSGGFNFSDRETSLPGFTNQTGHPFASFMLGGADSAGRSVYTTEPGYRQGFVALFVQDDWKATPKLTLNLGLRWEIPLPQTEAFNRMSGIDNTLPNPDADGFPGAVTYLGNCPTCNGRTSFQDSYYREVGPRFGVAYNAAKNLVLRGGYGISYSPPIWNNFGTHNIQGFNGTVNVAKGTSPTGFTLDPATYWSTLTGAPLPPSALVGLPPFQGSLPDRSPTIANGTGIDFLPLKSLAQPYTQNWSAGFQYQFPRDIVLEADYVGSKGTRLLQSMFSNMFNQAPSQYMPLGDILAMPLAGALADPATAATLAQYGITKLPYPSFATTNFNPTVAQALRPFPQYDVVTNNFPTMGLSTYNSLQVSARKRTSHGLSFIAAYTYSKTLTNSDTALYYPTGGFGIYNFGQNFYDRRAEKSIAAFDYPQVFKFTWIYELPFGSGKHWLNSGGRLNYLVGGWTVTGIQIYRSGTPLSIVTEQCTGIYSGAYGDGCSVRANIVPGVPQTMPLKGLDAVNGTPYLNPAAFVDPPLSPNNGYAMEFGSAPRFLPNIRGPGFQGEDFGVLKDTRFGERFDFQVRADFFNVFNRTGRGDPVTDVDGGSFGLIFGPAHGPRIIQLAMRLNF